MKLISKFNKGFKCVIDMYSKYALVIPLKRKNEITVTNPFQKILDESNRNSTKVWVDKGSEFYNRSMKSFRIMIYKCIQHIMKKIHYC